ncbi:MAG: DNA polymerase [Ruminobacter sp.]|uniref:DNA polymerase n=1 Tax=Ruminobacter sp. TaxID=2774296 RepID=UPI001B5547D6|nr:DNA polymerase [Ruminobacter sp.]MBP3749782.1 DNA polymerase [Ruminobacter sp.]
MKTISCDIECFSSIDLSKGGVYRYCEAPDFEILLFAYSVDGGPVQVVDLASGEKIPDKIIQALKDDSVIKWAWNANFERVCLSRYLGQPTGTYLSPEGWHCDMVWAATMGLPLSLEGAGAVIGLDKQKLAEGKDLIRYFCVPCTPTQTNGGRTRNLPRHAPDKWELFKRYNIRDVEAEMGIHHRLSKFPVPNFVWDEYHLDQNINDRGVRIDMTLVQQSISMDERSRNDLISAMKEFTQLENPNSVQQMKDWLAENGLMTDSLDKKAVAELLKNAPPELTRVLTLRQQLAKSSVKKYQAMQNAVCSDGRARGLFRFYGANRTGRFSSKIIQLQNLPQNHLPDLAEARALVRSGDFDAVSILYEDVPDTLSQLIRTAFIPTENKLFYVADFSAIEARVIAWYAGETWRQELFAKGGDIYCMSASQMFKVPVEKHGVNSHLRQKGKIAELACGYGGSTGALKNMGALEMGLKEEELQPLVNAWRNSNQNIVKFWWAVDKAVMDSVRNRTTTRTHGLTFTCQSGMLFITLPSGRKLAYVKPRIGINQFGGDCITYEGVGTNKKWERIESYGPKFVENIVQATSRDILLYAMNTLRHCDIVMHIHDELVIEADQRMSLDALCEQMARTPPWADGLVLNAAGYITPFYKKD